MKKLSNKIFGLLFGILTIFLVGTLFIFNYNSYNEVKRKVQTSLNIMNTKNDDRNPPDIGPREEKADIRFFGATVYTVIIDGEEVEKIISHNINQNSKDNIKKIAQNIINNKKKGTYIGNLYFEKYSYSYTDNIVIVDNSSVNKNLLRNLKTCIILFIIIEGIVILTSYKLTKWITKPVIETFNKQKDFIADASHELKTPLTVIIASAESLDSENKMVKNILNESERMNKLILSLLDLAKSENNNKEYSLINLSKLIEKSILTYESLIYEKGFKLKYNIEDNIKLLCDADEIKQVMSILIDNAIKHTSNEGIIKIDLSSSKKEIIINVKNKGEVISKEDEEKIFERFYKVDKSRNRNQNRYGLGLAIAKNIVANHNGNISAHSNNGYTNFKITFKK